LFVTMIVASIVALLVALSVSRRLQSRHGVWNAGLAGAGGFIVLVVAAQLALPTVNEVPGHFPADVLWRFRIASIGIEAVLWATVGLVFGPLAERILSPQPELRARRP
jgi:predicted cobalt transporter CbtA